MWLTIWILKPQRVNVAQNSWRSSSKCFAQKGPHISNLDRVYRVVDNHSRYEQDTNIAKELGRVWDTFFGPYGKLRPIQRNAIISILEGQNTLVISPTASGKTEAVLAPVTKRLIDCRWEKPSVLYISPTRSLINDLHERLWPRFRHLGLSCGRRTGEYRQTDVHVLLTTPESFDSMLVRGWLRDSRKKVIGHLLENVRVAILDEIHLLHGTVRGEQLVWLLVRLRRILSSKIGGQASESLQVCALSATVPDPLKIREKYLGNNAQIVTDETKSRNWCLLKFKEGYEEKIVKDTDGPRIIWDHITVIEGHGEILARSVAKGLRSLFRLRDASGQRGYKKVLVFVGSRKKCDSLSTHLSIEDLGPATGAVFPHHGSLSKEKRERTENALRTQQGAVCVSTMTLELGIDIGDIDLIVLIEPPMDVQSLMQRVGRGCRRSNQIKIWPIAHSPMQQVLLAGLISDGVGGLLQTAPTPNFLSVYLQQISSYIMQSPRRFRAKAQIVNLVREIPRACLNDTDLDEFILDCLNEGVFSNKVAHLSELQLGDTFSDRSSVWGFLHGNLSPDFNISLVNHWTGDDVAYVSEVSGKQFAVAGKRYNIQKVEGRKISVIAAHGRERPGDIAYQARRFPVGVSLTQQLLKYFGLPAEACVRLKNGYVAHFGGDFVRTLLRNLEIVGLTCNTWVASRECEDTFTRNWSHAELKQVVSENWETFRYCVPLGSYFRYLPLVWQERAVIEALDLPWWADWLSAREIVEIDPIKSSELQNLLF